MLPSTTAGGESGRAKAAADESRDIGRYHVFRPAPRRSPTDFSRDPLFLGAYDRPVLRDPAGKIVVTLAVREEM